MTEESGFQCKAASPAILLEITKPPTEMLGTCGRSLTVQAAFLQIPTAAFRKNAQTAMNKRAPQMHLDTIASNVYKKIVVIRNVQVYQM